MACNVFGTPVTVETLKGIPEYADKETITRKDLAEVALALKNAEGKDVNARTYVENMYKRYEGLYCALGLIYNATGAPLWFHGAKNIYGFAGPAPYPAFIENGQWGAFVSVTLNKRENEGASDAVIYRGHDFYGSEVDFVVGWDTRVLPTLSNVYVDMDQSNCYYDGMSSDRLLGIVQKSGQHSVCTKGDLFSFAMIGSGKMAVLEVIHRLKLTAPAPAAAAAPAPVPAAAAAAAAPAPSAAAAPAPAPAPSAAANISDERIRY